MSTKKEQLQARWIFTAEQLKQTPSIKAGMTDHEELFQRQMAAGLIRKIGQKLKESCKRPNGLCVNTAMVYMHRFYMFHSFQKFPGRVMAPCALFLAAKVEETPIKLEFVIKTSHMIQNPGAPPLSEKMYEEIQKELIANENLLLQTIGFDLEIVHPHTSVITRADLIGVPKLTTKLAYELASNSLHFTTMGLQYSPGTVAAVCLNMAFKGCNLAIDQSREGKDWWNYLEDDLKFEKILEVQKEFLSIIDRNKKSFNKWVTKQPSSDNHHNSRDKQ